MSEAIKTPELDLKVLQEKAQEAAMKGALEVVEKFYSDYDSPYKKSIEEALKQKGFDHAFDLPDVVASINQSLSTEIDRIANTAISKTFLPMVTEFLTREEKEMKFSKVLEKFIECVKFDHEEQDFDDFTVEVEKEDRWFLRLVISDGKETYDVNLSCGGKKEDNPSETAWEIYSLPFAWRSPTAKQTMKVSLDGGATLEMPFTKGVLEDRFVSFCARLTMAQTKIYLDVREFDESMFPERDECHC